MLVLKRNEDESFFILGPNGEEIFVNLISAHGNHAYLGVYAPADFEIFREELMDGTKHGRILSLARGKTKKQTDTAAKNRFRETGKRIPG